MTSERLQQISQWVQRHGPGNCWTGTSGEPAVMLNERVRVYGHPLGRYRKAGAA